MRLLLINQPPISFPRQSLFISHASDLSLLLLSQNSTHTHTNKHTISKHKLINSQIDKTISQHINLYTHRHYTRAIHKVAKTFANTRKQQTQTQTPHTQLAIRCLQFTRSGQFLSASVRVSVLHKK